MSELRLPHDLVAEQGVIGGCLVHGAEVAAAVFEHIQPEDCYERRHRAILLAVHQLWDRGEPVDEITVTSYLHDAGQLQAVGGPAFLAELADIAITPAHVEAYARRVADKARLRRLIKACQTVIEQAYKGQDAEAVLEAAQETVGEVVATKPSSRAVSMRELVPRLYVEAKERQEARRDPRAVLTGFAALDEVITGLYPGELITVGAQTGMGKSSLLLGVAANVAIRQGRRVLYVCREQRAEALAGWLICREGRINTRNWRAGRLSPHEERQAKAVRPIIERARLHWLRVTDRGERAVRSIRSHARALRGVALIVVDYIQLLAETQRPEAISAISTGLKNLAMETDVPVLAASQLNREVDRREDKRPVLADLRGSGTIEQDSDVIALLYRPSYYDPLDQDRTVHVLVAKNRGGARTPLKLAFWPEFVRFEDCEEQPQASMF